MSADPFTPVRIGTVELANRLALAPMKTAFGGTDGAVSPRHVAYYRRRAEGGAGLIIVEPLFVDPRGREHPRQLGGHADEMIGGLQELVEAVHQAGAVVFAHLNHAGRAANPEAIGGAPEAPSSVPCPITGAMPTVMSGERILQIVRAYAGAARRARVAGFDGVELQLGLGYLPAQFLSSLTNNRTDRYAIGHGGGWTFIEELIRAVQGALGETMALTARLSADEQVEGGLDLEDAIELAHHLQRWGVDGLHVVTGSACDSPPWYYQHMALPAGRNERLAASLRSMVSMPVMVAGRPGDPDRIRSVLQQGMADVVALGRPLLADPDLPRKMKEGREDEIMACGACLQGCLAAVKAGGPLRCLINPELGREGEPDSPVATEGEHLVVGGGPAGMQAALSAQRRGYAVTLVERNATLGGHFRLAFETPGKRAMEQPFQSLVRAVERSGVHVRTGVEVTVATILDLQPERVVIATGSRPIIPSIPGLVEPLTAEQVLSGAREPGHRVLILGGGLVGIELAEYLARRGRDIVVVELLDDVARDMEAITRRMTLLRLRSMPVTVHSGTRLTRLEDGEAFVRVRDAVDETSLGHFDSVVVAVGYRSHDPLSRELVAAGLAVSVVGDAAAPGQILDATQTGHAAVQPERRSGRPPKRSQGVVGRGIRRVDLAMGEGNVALSGPE